ncbi:MAG: LptF/LptG family permease [Candidatus Sericytochromatia bacterium]
MKLPVNYIIDRYIFLEFLFPFIFSLGLFLSITVFGFVIFNLIDMMIKYGLGLDLVLKLFLYSIPEMFLYSIPMSVLLSSILFSSRLYRDNEIIIFQNSGISNKRLFLPVFLFVFVLTILSIFFNYFIVSKANFELTKANYLAYTKKSIPIQKENIFYKEFDNSYLKRTFYANRFLNNTMYRPVVQEYDNNNLSKIISSEKLELEGNIWKFSKGYIYILEKGEIKSSLKFENYSFPFMQSLNKLANEIRSPKEMNYKELKEHIDILKKTGEKTSHIEVQLYQKISIPFVSLVFFFIGTHLGLNKKSKNTSFAYTFSLFFIFLYYICLFCFTALGSIGIINPLISAWLPNILCLFILLL